MVLLSVSSIFAATILTGETVRITEPIEGNAYIGAGTVTIDAIVNGDVTVGAGEIQILDTIREDLIVGGGRVRVDGVIGDDIRCGGGEVKIFGNVLGDVIVGCGTLEIGPDVVVYGDLVIAGGEVRISGTVKGSIIMAGGEVSFDGIAEKDVEIRGGEVTLDGDIRGPAKLAAKEIVLRSNAQFAQDVRYWQVDGELDFTGHLRGDASAVYDTSLKQDMEKYDNKWFSKGFGVFSVYRFFAGAVLVALLLWLFHSFFRRSGAGLPDQWINRFGTGILYFIGVPVAAILLFITLIGIPIGLFVLFFYIFSLLFAPALTAAVGANVWEQSRGLSWSTGQRIMVGIGLLLILRLLMWIPVAGPLLGIILVSIAFGSLIKALITHPAAE